MKDQILPFVTTVVNNLLGGSMKHLKKDLIQSSCLKCLEKYHKYNPQKGTFFSWVYSVTKFHFIDELRKKGKEVNIDFIDDIYIFKDIMDDTFDNSTRKQVFESIYQLPEKQKKVVLLKTKFNCSAREISELTGIPENQVAAYFYRAKDTLRTNLAA
jgi:RNA polymerase sigma factor (sigma-70 family)